MLKWKWNDKINMFIHGLLHGTRLWHYYSELYTCIQVFSHFYLFFFLHLRFFKHYLSLEMYYIKVMINFTKNNHFFFYFAYHYLPLFFFTWQKANPSVKNDTCLEFSPTLLRNRAVLNSFQSRIANWHFSNILIPRGIALISRSVYLIHTECVFVPTTVLLFTDK